MMMNKILAIGCDDAAVELKQLLMTDLIAKGIEVQDYGIDAGITTYYPDIAYKLASAIKLGKHQLGILCCGTGIGMAITANKVSGIRAAQAHDTYSAQRARKSNNAQILTLGSRVIGVELAKEIVHAFINSEFEPALSGEKVKRIHYFEALDKKIP
ncbi:MAG: RpiB/LacA/LacB family sugar-phosphate isomerase [Ostreibacterium sp.]